MAKTSNDILYHGFVSHINEKNLLTNNHKVLLAVSGGMDSMTMADLFGESTYQFAMAHCNFQLRGKESDLDARLVEEIATQKKVPIYTTFFNTKTYARQHKLSVQMAARALRYEWLEKVRMDKGFDFVATAHHLDDSIETLLINLARGSGIRGLTGIPVKSGHVIRPLLFATRNDIEAYASKKSLQYREDRSNREDVYIRNKIRHHVIPQLKEVNPSLQASLAGFMSAMEDTVSIFEQQVALKKEACIQSHGEETHVLIKPLTELPSAHLYLYEFLKAFGFPAATCADILQSATAQAGKIFYSGSHMVVKDRDAWIVTKKQETPATSECYLISKETEKLIAGNTLLQFSSGQFIGKPEITTNQLVLTADMQKLTFPLVWRKWKAGDYLCPIGMGGRKKKISDLLVDIKMPLHQKKHVMVLTSNQQIVWVAGIRADERFAIKHDTKQYYMVDISETHPG